MDEAKKILGVPGEWVTQHCLPMDRSPTIVVSRNSVVFVHGARPRVVIRIEKDVCAMVVCANPMIMIQVDRDHKPLTVPVYFLSRSSSSALVSFDWISIEDGGAEEWTTFRDFCVFGK
jgi:hypothetical protein